MADKAEFTLVNGDDDADNSGPSRRRKLKILAIVVGVVALVVLAFVVGYVVRRAVSPGCKVCESEQEQTEAPEPESLYEEAVDAISAANIEGHLR